MNKPLYCENAEDRPTRYVGRPPHTGWERWEDCIEGSHLGRTEGSDG